jgi:two-component system, NarL family, nitrate/nitrite response regulator NarL
MHSKESLTHEGVAPALSSSREGVPENRQARIPASPRLMGGEESSTRTVIADAHAVFRYGLRRLLESESGFRVIGEASEGTQVVKLTRQLKPDLVLLDLALPGRSGLEVLCDLVTWSPSLRIVLLTTAIEKSQVVEAFQLGAHGLVLKGASPRVLMESVRTVIRGQYWLTRESLAFVVGALHELAPRNGNGSPKNHGLTSRELAVTERVVAGFSNKDLGQEFSISERTVKRHLTNIYEKLGISNRLELAVFAMNHHLSAPG